MPLSIADMMEAVPTRDHPELSSWHQLNKVVHKYTEEDCISALKDAIKKEKPWRFVNRIYCRYSRMRMTREQLELNLPHARGYKK